DRGGDGAGPARAAGRRRAARPLPPRLLARGLHRAGGRPRLPRGADPGRRAGRALAADPRRSAQDGGRGGRRRGGGLRLGRPAARRRPRPAGRAVRPLRPPGPLGDGARPRAAAGGAGGRRQLAVGVPGQRAGPGLLRPARLPPRRRREGRGLLRRRRGPDGAAVRQPAYGRV
ncbi:MAG: hypothetical protein AVDCRST_MAG48-426, partial [uncultured Friedmanniella sp.]